MKAGWILALIIGGIIGYLVYPLIPANQTRTISTFTGTASTKAIPNEYIFYPNYESTNSDAAQATNDVSTYGNSVVDKLVELGVEQSQISVDVNSNDVLIAPVPYPGADISDLDEYTAHYSLTITVDDADLAKVVLDYLATTGSVGGITPVSTFSKETRNKLQDEVRALAFQNARKRAEDAASSLGVKLGKLIAAHDYDYGGPIAYSALEATSSPDSSGSDFRASFTAPYLLTTEQEVSYSVSVEYELK